MAEITRTRITFIKGDTMEITLLVNTIEETMVHIMLSNYPKSLDSEETFLVSILS